MMMKWPSHGGQPAAIKQQFHMHPDTPLLDFSANLNPLGPPGWLEEGLLSSIQALKVYPDPEYTSARHSVAEFEGCSAEQVLVTNGGAEAVFLAAKCFEGKQAVIVHPAFAEYERACSHYHCGIISLLLDIENNFAFPLKGIMSAMKKQDIGSVFLCRPQNPTGTVIEEAAIIELLELGKQTGTSVIVDEAFADFMPEGIPSLAHLINRYSNLILLRSLTKMYTLPGLRIGYVLSNPTTIEQLQGYQIPWSVNAIAEGLLPMLLKDRTWERETKQWLIAEWNGLKEAFKRLQFEYTDSFANFYLLRDTLRSDDTEQLFKFLLAHGILPRHTHNFLGLDGRYLRLAVRSKPENERLIKLLAKWREA
jgi:threonine-phosphate decarboxylase